MTRLALPLIRSTSPNHMFVPEAAIQAERDRIADHLLNLMPSEMRLHMGEMSAQELRTIIAFIGWQAARIRSGDLS